MSEKEMPIVIKPCNISSRNGARIFNMGEAKILRTSSSGLDTNERKSIQALVAYTAMNMRKPESDVLQILIAKFNVPDIDHIGSRSYEDVIRFLVDLCEMEPRPEAANDEF